MAQTETTTENVAGLLGETASNSSRDEEPLRLIGPRRLTRFEKARVIGARALQIAMGAPVLLKLPTEISDPVDMASRELSGGVLPITVRRRLPNGTYQDIPIQWLLPEDVTAPKPD